MSPWIFSRLEGLFRLLHITVVTLKPSSVGSFNLDCLAYWSGPVPFTRSYTLIYANITVNIRVWT